MAVAKRAKDQQASSAPLNFELLLSDPYHRRAAEDAQAVAMVGELIRSLIPSL